MANIFYQPAALSCSGCRHRGVLCVHIPPPCETCNVQFESWGKLCRHQIACGPREDDWGEPQTPVDEARSEQRHAQAQAQHRREREAYCAVICARQARREADARRAQGLPTADTSPVQTGDHQGMPHCVEREARMAGRRERQRAWRQCKEGPE